MSQKACLIWWRCFSHHQSLPTGESLYLGMHFPYGPVVFTAGFWVVCICCRIRRVVSACLFFVSRIYSQRCYVMDMEKNQKLGRCIGQLIRGENLSEESAYNAFCMVLANEVSEMHQGAFLAALTAKGETAAEVAGGWKAVYELDTVKVNFDGLAVVDNCGTGMDTFKTFNISTAASLVAAAGGVKIARHGARAITSSCGTVDMVELLGVDVECGVDLVKNSVIEAGIGLFNGMSSQVHPMALGRILSQICFGSPLNIAASLAHPGLPKFAVRGVYSPALLQPVAEVMQVIGYSDAIVIYGAIDGSDKGMDEASVCGETVGVRLSGGKIEPISFVPEEVGVSLHAPELLISEKNRDIAAKNMCELFAGRGSTAQNDAVILNSSLIFYVQNQVSSIQDGVTRAR
ncbi:MAG: anthranilate phosphoribosyltransferase, partial [Desulfopila sp.]